MRDLLRGREGYSDVTRGAYKLPIRWNGLDIRTGLRQRYCNDRSRLKGDHFPSISVCQGANRAGPKVCAEHPVKCIRAATSLKMAEHDASRFFAGHALDRLSNVVPHPPKSKLLRVGIHLSLPNLSCTFGNDDVRKSGAGPIPLFNLFRD